MIFTPLPVIFLAPEPSPTNSIRTDEGVMSKALPWKTQLELRDFLFVLDLFKGVIFPARAAIELHATSRARQAYAPSYEADAVTRGSAG